VRRLLILAVALLATAELAGAAWPAPAGRPSAAIPAPAAKAMRRAIGASAFLPTFLPAGYQFAGWKNESPNVAPIPGAPWLVVTFKRGTVRLVWTVIVTPGAGGDQRCSDLSIGHATVAGQLTYWGPLTTYDPLGGGPKGRHVWRCANSATPTGSSSMRSTKEHGFRSRS